MLSLASMFFSASSLTPDWYFLRWMLASILILLDNNISLMPLLLSIILLINISYWHIDITFSLLMSLLLMALAFIDYFHFISILIDIAIIAITSFHWYLIADTFLITLLIRLLPHWLAAISLSCYYYWHWCLFFHIDYCHWLLILPLRLASLAFLIFISYFFSRHIVIISFDIIFLLIFTLLILIRLLTLVDTIIDWIAFLGHWWFRLFHFFAYRYYYAFSLSIFLHATFRHFRLSLILLLMLTFH